MFSPRLYSASALRRLTLFCLAGCLTNWGLLQGQTNASSRSSGSHSIVGASQRSTTSASQGTKTSASSPAGGIVANNSRGSGLGSSGKVNSGQANSAQGSVAPTYGHAAARRARSEANQAASGGGAAGTQNDLGAGYVGLPTEFVYGNSAQANGGNPTPILPDLGPGNFAQARNNVSYAGQNLAQGAIPRSVSLGDAASATLALTSTATAAFGSEPVAAPPSPVGLAIADRLRRLPALHFLTDVRVDFDGQTAILRGTVATRHDRELAERVVRLEATVDEVSNLLEVAGLAATQKLPPPPAPGGSLPPTSAE
jgi:hypothetical protein